MKTLALFLCTIALTGCLTIPKEEAFRPLTNKQSTLSITWVVSDTPTRECNHRFSEVMETHPIVIACAGWDPTKQQCTIVTGTVTTHQILGHEIRHCFEGKFHD